MEIYFYDLTEQKQEEILDFYNIKSAEEANLDSFPLFYLEEIEDED